MSGKSRRKVIKTEPKGKSDVPITQQTTLDDENQDDMKLQAEYKLLQTKDKQLDKEIAVLEKALRQPSEATSYMEQLHVYNDVKDATQLVLGNLARLEDVSVTELHKQYGLSYTDNDA